MFQKLSIFALFISFISVANAGLLIDPYFGNSNATAVVDNIPAQFENEGTATGTTFGSRVGYSFSMFSFGVDYGIYSTDKTDASDMSLFVGLDLPFLFRFWVEYYLSSDGQSIFLEQASETYDLVFNEGTSIGIGFTGLPFVSVNFEAITKKYTVEDTFFGDLPVAFADYVISLSFPIEF